MRGLYPQRPVLFAYIPQHIYYALQIVQYFVIGEPDNLKALCFQIGLSALILLLFESMNITVDLYSQAQLRAEEV